MDIFEAIAISCSVPFKSKMTGAQVREIVYTGILAKDFRPHMRRFLEELPIEMVAKSAFEFPSDEQGAVLKNIRNLAIDFGYPAKERIEKWMTG